MIEYGVQKNHPDGYGGNINERYIIKKSEKQKYLSEDFHIYEKRYYFITSFIDWWSKFKIEVKLSIITMFIGAFYFFLSMCLDNRYADLEDNYESLDENYIQLNKTLIMTSDSLKVERNLSQYLRKELKIKTTKN